MPGARLPASAQAGLLTGVGHQAGLVLAPGSRGGRSARARIPGLVRRRRRGGRAAAAGAGSSASLWPGKLGITRSTPVSAKTRRTMALAGMASRSSPPSARARLCARTKTPSPAESQDWVAGHVHYERGAAAGRGFEENRPQPPGVAGIDIRGRRHHGVRKDAEPGFLRLSGLHQGRDGHRVCFGGSPDAGLRRRAVLHRRRARA